MRTRHASPDMAPTSTTSLAICTATRRYFFLHDGVSELLPDDEDKSASVALTVEPLVMLCNIICVGARGAFTITVTTAAIVADAVAAINTTVVTMCHRLVLNVTITNGDTHPLSFSCRARK